MADELDEILALSGYDDDDAFAMEGRRMAGIMDPKLGQPAPLFYVAAGVPVTSIGAGLDARIRVNVSEPFRAQKLVLETASLPLRFTDIKVSTQSQNVGDGPIVGGAFTADGTAMLKGTVAKAGVGIELLTNNPTAGALDLAGTAFGPASGY